MRIRRTISNKQVRPAGFDRIIEGRIILFWDVSTRISIPYYFSMILLQMILSSGSSSDECD